MAVTITEITYGTVKKIKFAWTSAADGTASGATPNVYDGQALMLVTDPDGTDAPTDNYDITITDSDGVDVLAGVGADRDTAVTEYVVANLGAVAKSKLTINVANAGAAKKGIAYLYIR